MFCVGVISNIWSNRNRVKTTDKGKTSPLFVQTIVNPIEFVSTNDFTYDYQYISKEVKTFIQKEMNDSNNNTWYKSRVFYNSYLVYKNPKQFSEDVKIPYISVIKTCNQYKEKLKKKFKNILFYD